MSSPVIVALDGMNQERALQLAEELRGEVWGFKVNDLLLDCGVEIIRRLSKFGHVFADPKLNDIPNTVSNSVRKLVAAGADLITVHGSAGEVALKKAKEAAGDSKILAITVLTSFAPSAAEYVFGKNVDAAVTHFAGIAAQSGVDGVVCSPKELTLLSKEPALRALLKVTPGVRPAWYESAGDDQSRTLTPREAMQAGAGLLVIGRPITGAENPLEAARRVNQELLEG